MTLKERYVGVLAYFAERMPNPATELHYNSPFEILVAVILSAQCTDKRVNLITPRLFEAYPTAEAMAQASVDDILHFISSVSYPNSKARHLQAMAAMLTDKFHGQVPDNMTDLTSLPGVGRKTANVVMGTVFGKPTIAVDTHVFRVSNRIGLAKGKTPIEVEAALTKNIPPEQRYKAHHWLLLHGRYICKSQRPNCLECPITRFCAYYRTHTSHTTT